MQTGRWYCDKSGGLDYLCVMQIVPLSEGAFTIDKTKLFVPFDTGLDDLQQRPVGSLLVEIQPFVVVTTDDIVLLDTGLGFESQGKLQLHANLERAGIEPAKVTKVLLSHLHKDHAGGICPEGRMSFPHAQYFVQRRELDYAYERGPTSYLVEELDCLKTSPQVVFLDGDGILDGYIRYRVTGAHCPWHQAFWIVDGGETAFFGGDVAPTLQQMKSRFVAKYDVDGKRAMEWRQEWWAQGQAEGWTFLFYHDVKAPVWPVGA
jgi:glyoxylase-like metal-dependent hydrolase (beta-lactamase superfamily II)